MQPTLVALSGSKMMRVWRAVHSDIQYSSAQHSRTELQARQKFAVDHMDRENSLLVESFMVRCDRD